MEVSLGYGRGRIGLEVPEKMLGQIIRPAYDTDARGNRFLVAQALDTKEIDRFTADIRAREVCVLVGDGTRDMPLADVCAQLFDFLAQSRRVTIILCTGTHSPATPANERVADVLDSACTDAGFKNYSIHVHDYSGPLVQAPSTSRGTQVWYNPLVDEADVFLVLSDVKCHYFGGYSNPVKNFVPGICGYITAEGNHSLALNPRSTFGVHPWHDDSSRKDNPLAADKVEAMETIVKSRNVYSFLTISTRGSIQWAGFGPAKEICSRAFDEVDQRNCRKVIAADYLIVSPGGMPNDVDLYISQRALELTKAAVKAGGQILFLSACPRGVGEPATRENFYDLLIRPLDEIFATVGTDYKLFQHKPYKFAELIRATKRIWMYSQLEDEVVRAMHLEPTDDPQAVINGWKKIGGTMHVVDGGNKVALYG